MSLIVHINCLSFIHVRLILNHMTYCGHQGILGGGEHF